MNTWNITVRKCSEKFSNYYRHITLWTHRSVNKPLCNIIKNVHKVKIFCKQTKKKNFLQNLLQLFLYAKKKKKCVHKLKISAAFILWD